MSLLDDVMDNQRNQILALEAENARLKAELAQAKAERLVDVHAHYSEKTYFCYNIT